MKKPLLYSIAIVLFDQFTKILVIKNLSINESIAIAPFMQLTFVTNTGVSFSMFREVKGANTFFAVFAALTIALISWWYFKHEKEFTTLSAFGLLLVISGAVGNLIDRIVHGYVIDFLDFFVGSYHWPAFNMADSCITIGGILLIFTLFVSSATQNKNNKN